MRITPGRYNARAVKWEIGEAEKTGNPRIVVDFVISEGPEAGKTLTWSGMLHDDKSFARTSESMKACGWDEASIESPVGLNKNEVSVTVEDNEYQGKTNSRIAWVNPLRAPSKPVAPERKSALLQRFANWKNPKPATTYDPTSDDVPFG